MLGEFENVGFKHRLMGQRKMILALTRGQP